MKTKLRNCENEKQPGQAICLKYGQLLFFNSLFLCKQSYLPPVKKQKVNPDACSNNTNSNELCKQCY
jgi:hypothetical protein